jgi:hypothetical protein
MPITLNGNTGIVGPDGSAGTPAIQGSDSNTGMFFPAADTIAFAEGGAEVARFDSSGNFGIGTSSPGGFKLNVAGSAAISGNVTLADYANIGATNNNAGISLTGGSATNNGGQINLRGGSFSGNTSGIEFITAGTERARIDSVGNILFGASSTAIPTTSTTDVFLGGIIMTPSRRTTSSGANVNIDPTSGVFARSTSSLKYKKDVLNAPWGLADVMKLRAVTYKSVVETDGDTVFGGLIAEEIHDAGLTEFVQYGPDGSPDALAYGNMVSLCIKAIQELKAELDGVKAELATLKGQA